MNVLERYYMQSTALARVQELVEAGRNVSIRRDQDDGKPVWKVEWA